MYSIENCVNTFNPDKVEKTKVGYQYWFADKKFADGDTVELETIWDGPGYAISVDFSSIDSAYNTGDESNRYPL